MGNQGGKAGITISWRKKNGRPSVPEIAGKKEVAFTQSSSALFSIKYWLREFAFPKKQLGFAKG